MERPSRSGASRRQAFDKIFNESQRGRLQQSLFEAGWYTVSPAQIGARIVAGGVFGLFFDSLLGATLERRGWLNNDTVNFLSTAGAAAFALALLALLHRP